MAPRSGWSSRRREHLDRRPPRGPASLPQSAVRPHDGHPAPAQVRPGSSGRAGPRASALLAGVAQARATSTPSTVAEQSAGNDRGGVQGRATDVEARAGGRDRRSGRRRRVRRVDGAAHEAARVDEHRAALLERRSIRMASPCPTSSTLTRSTPRGAARAWRRPRAAAAAPAPAATRREPPAAALRGRERDRSPASVGQLGGRRLGQAQLHAGVRRGAGHGA